MQRSSSFLFVAKDDLIANVSLVTTITYFLTSDIANHFEMKSTSETARIRRLEKPITGLVAILTSQDTCIHDGRNDSLETCIHSIKNLEMAPN